jgi:hypothetical protein
VTVYRFDENAVRFRVVTKEDFEADHAALYVISGFSGLLVRDGDSAPKRFPADGRLVVAGAEFTPDDFSCWRRYRNLRRLVGAPLDPREPPGLPPVFRFVDIES